MRQLELFLGHHSCLSGPGGHSRDRSPSEFGGREDHFTCVYGVGFPRLIHLGNSLWGNLIPTPPPPRPSATQTDVYLSESRRSETSKWPSQDLRRRIPCSLGFAPSSPFLEGLQKTGGLREAGRGRRGAPGEQVGEVGSPLR